MSDAPTDAPSIPESALPPGADANYVAQMVARADGVKLPAADAPPPADAPKADAPPPPADKPVDWEKRYKDLQAEYTRLKQAPPKAEDAPKAPDAPQDGDPPKAEDAPKADAPPPADDTPVPPEAAEAKSVTDKAGLDWNEVNTHFAQHGALSDDHFAKLEAVGIPRAMAEQYVEGQKALNASRRADILSAVGGEETYKSVTEWAAKSLSADEIQSFNTIVTGSDINAAKIAVAGLHARFAAANGTEPKLISGDNTPPSSGGFRSVAEMKKAMADPRYGTDPAYREDVARRVAASSAI